MANVSLNSSIRTCKIETGSVNRIQSDRFLNPNNNVCIPWNNRDNLGRLVCEDSFYTKREGCNSALDRVDVENHLRPQYAEYVNLDAAGFQSDIYSMNSADAQLHTDTMGNVNKVTGNFGLDFSANRQVSCGGSAYEQGMAMRSQQNRALQHAQVGMKSQQNAQRAGF